MPEIKIVPITEMPAVKAAWATVNKLRARQSAISARVNAINLKFAGEEDARKEREKHADQVRGYLTAGTLPEHANLRAELASLMKEMALAKEAEGLAVRQLKTAEQAASRDLCSKLAAAHKGLVAEAAKSLIQAAERFEELDSFYDQLKTNGYQGGELKPVRFNSLRSGQDENSLVAWFLSELVANDLISPGLIPQTWLKRWATPAPWLRSKAKSQRWPKISAGPGGLTYQAAPKQPVTVSKASDENDWTGGR
jgi:hypothetical protein